MTEQHFEIVFRKGTLETVHDLFRSSNNNKSPASAQQIYCYRLRAVTVSC